MTAMDLKKKNAEINAKHKLLKKNCDRTAIEHIVNALLKGAILIMVAKIFIKLLY